MTGTDSAPPRPEVHEHDPGPHVRGGSTVAWIVSLLLAAVLGALLFIGGWLVGGAGGGVGTCVAPSEQFAAFCEAYDKLKTQHVDDLDDGRLVEGAIQGMFDHGVDDPNSGYMPPDHYQTALGDLSGRFEGIGAEMGRRNLEDPGNLEPCRTFTAVCVMVVISPLADSPAEAAGVQPGDIVRAVDGTSVDGTTMEEQIGNIRGPAGTDVTLTLERNGTRHDVTITRAEIQMREVRTRMIDDQIGYISLRGFSDASTDQFAEGLEELIGEGASQIVFDLRNNPGGYIVAAQRIASQFVDSGVIFTQELSGGRVEEHRAQSGGAATDPRIDLVVLTNEGSASASEIVAAALKELGRATLIGQPTYGKNTVQVWAPLANAGGIRITVSRWYTPDHNTVAPGGIEPDIVVEIPPNIEAGDDPILDRAVEELSARRDGATGALEPSPRTAWGRFDPGLLIGYASQGRTVADA